MWYTLEELGIVEVWEINDRALQIVVDREKEPFPFGPYGTPDQRTYFLYKGEFYLVHHSLGKFFSFRCQAVADSDRGNRGSIGRRLGLCWSTLP